MLLENKSSKIDMLIGTNQPDCDDTYAFSRDKRYAFFQYPFQVHYWQGRSQDFIKGVSTGSIDPRRGVWGRSPQTLTNYQI